MMRERHPPGEAGYSLIELMVVVAMIATLTAVSTELLAQRPAELGSAVQQFALKLDETRALALANAGRLDAANGTEAAAGGGATLWVRPDPNDANYSVVSVFWYRPIIQSSTRGFLIADALSEPLRIHGSVSVTVPGDGTDTAFAVFVAPSGHLSVATNSKWRFNSGPLGVEPLCDVANPPQVKIEERGNSKIGTLVCSDARFNLP
jgi:prepilin-type N-terminal cleavage/methylation domain-containing protein